VSLKERESETVMEMGRRERERWGDELRSQQVMRGEEHKEQDEEEEDVEHKEEQEGRCK